MKNNWKRSNRKLHFHCESHDCDSSLSKGNENRLRISSLTVRLCLGEGGHACFQSRPQDSLRKATVLASECPLMSALGLSVHRDCLWRRKKSRELKARWEKLPCREMRREFRRWGQVGPRLRDAVTGWSVGQKEGSGVFIGLKGEAIVWRASLEVGEPAGAGMTPVSPPTAHSEQ